MAVITPEKMKEIGEAFERFQATKELDPGIIEYIFTVLDHINDCLTSIGLKDAEDFFKVIGLEKRINELDDMISDLQDRASYLYARIEGLQDDIYKLEDKIETL